MKSAFALLVVAAYATAHINDTADEKACWDALPAPGGHDQTKGYFDTCIAQQSGLQAILDSLKAKHPKRTAGGSTGSSAGSGGHHGPEDHHGSEDDFGPGGHHTPGHDDPVSVLRGHGYNSEAQALLKCVAQEQGYLDASGSFKIQDYKNKLIASATSAGKQTEVQRGIDNCPTDALTAYDVQKYLHCVVSYCATGAAPTNK